MSKKTREAQQKHIRKNIDFLVKNRGKNDEKVGGSEEYLKNRENNCPGTLILGHRSIFGRCLGPPGDPKILQRAFLFFLFFRVALHVL